MGRAKKVLKLFISLALLLSLFAASTLLYGFLDTVRAPSHNNGGDEPVISAPSEPPSETPEEPPVTTESTPPPPVTDSPPVEPPPPTPAEDLFTQIKMMPSDIHKGNLVLINHDHSYDIPDTLDLVAIADGKTESYGVADDGLLLSSTIVGMLNIMMDSYFRETDRSNVTVTSAFRDYDRQQEILDEYIAQYGRTEALRWAALPGHSEHHAGLALDFGVYSSGAMRTFTGTGVTEWFPHNAHTFGFILRYPNNKSDITKTAYEPWHYRYVGFPHSFAMYENNFCLEEYIDFVRDFTLEAPFEFSFEGYAFLIYFTKNTEIRIPIGYHHLISGNNIDGFVVTIWQ